MEEQKAIIIQFYDSFKRRDAEGMIACYTSDIVFSDPVFGLLDSDHTKAMWRMLCAQAKDFSLTYGEVELLDDEYATCPWQARYTFSKTNRKVLNIVKAHMRIRDGLICEHSDQFNLYTWTQQAMGVPGWLFGWSNFMQKKIQSNARMRLENFMRPQA
jgi:ketosteroid isomerase-like protein